MCSGGWLGWVGSRHGGLPARRVSRIGLARGMASYSDLLWPEDSPFLSGEHVRPESREDAQPRIAELAAASPFAQGPTEAESWIGALPARVAQRIANAPGPVRPAAQAPCPLFLT